MSKEINKYTQKIFEKDYQDIIDLYNSGYSANKIAKQYKVTQSTIVRILMKTGNYIKHKTYKKDTKIKESEHQHIIELYQDGLTQSNISKKYNVSQGTIGNILKLYNIDTSTHVRKSKFSEIDVVEMYRLYTDDNCSSTVIAKMYNTDCSEVLKLFKQYGFSIRDTSHAYRKYTIDEEYFDNIDNQDKAYYLGLLWADGCNYTPNNSIIISLQESDKHILDELRNRLNSNKPLQFIPLNKKNPNHKNQYTFRVANKHMSNTLEEYGMCQRKSLVVKFPSCLPKELYSHFIRGYFDGDGCIPIADKYHVINMVGTKEMMETIQGILMEIGIKTQLKVHDPKTQSNTYLLRTSNTECSKNFLDYIYKDANLYLYRKHNLYLQKYCV